MHLSQRSHAVAGSAIRDLLALVDRPDVVSLAGGLPAAEAFPIERIRRATERVLSSDGPAGRYGPAALQYGPTQGLAVLRQTLAERSLDGPTSCEPDQIIITSGSQQGLDLVARALLDPGDVVAIERPAYVGAVQALSGSQPRFLPIEVDHDGLDTDQLEASLFAGNKVRLCYVTPNFQNPTGATLSEPRRKHLLRLAEHYGFLIVEDDPYRMLRYDGSDLTSLGARSDRVIRLGSASKTIAPGLRVGWIVAPPWLVEPIVRLKQAVDLHTASLNQLVVADLLDDQPFFEHHRRHLIHTYRTRRNALAEALRAHADFSFHEPEGGMFLWVTVPTADTSALLPRAVEHGVGFVPGAAFATCGRTGSDRFARQVRLSFASLAPGELCTAADRLVHAVREAATDPQANTSSWAAREAAR